MKCQLLSYILVVTAWETSMASSLRGSATTRMSEKSVTCRMTVQDTLLETASKGDTFDREQQTVCIPLLEGQVESDAIVPLELPSELLEAHESDLRQGLLWINIKNAELKDSQIHLSSNVEFSVAEPVPERQRRLQEQRTAGDKSVVLIRVSTIDSPNQNSRASLDAMFSPNGINFRTQYEQCSMNQLRFNKANRVYEVTDNFAVLDVTIPRPVSSFGTGPGMLVDAAQEQLRNTLGVSSVSSLADKVLFCLPAGTGNWVASAGLNHWRSQYNAGWCTSLSATMHELGHQMGLLHSNENFQAYEDRTGYMARGFRNPDWPRRCFNGQNNNHMGWYDDRKLSFDPLTSSARVVDLAAFVDYPKTVSPNVDPVLVSLSDELYVQYNRAKGMNAETGEMPDQVTIVTKLIQGGSQLVGGLLEGQAYGHRDFAGSGRTVYIKACRRSDGDSSTADKMSISIGVGSPAPCSASNNQATTMMTWGSSNTPDGQDVSSDDQEDEDYGRDEAMVPPPMDDTPFSLPTPTTNGGRGRGFTGTVPAAGGSKDNSDILAFLSDFRNGGRNVEPKMTPESAGSTQTSNNNNFVPPSPPVRGGSSSSGGGNKAILDFLRNNFS